MSRSKFLVKPESYIEYDKITDEFIVDYFKTKQCIVNGKLLSYYINKQDGIYDSNILKYLENRYSDSESIKETIYRINYGIEYRPVCRTCGGRLNPVFTQGFVFKTHCCNKCAANNPEVKSKLNLSEHTKKANDSRNKHWLEKTGGKYTNPSQVPEIKQKKEETVCKHFGVRNPFQSQEIINKFDKIRMAENAVKTKRRNNSFKQSRDEETIYEMLVEIFSVDNVIRQYIDKRYFFIDKHPYFCDFYIKSLDLFIEYNGTWTHGGAPYDETNKEHIDRLNLWKEKAKTSKYYSNAINTWTVKDVAKRKVCIDNNLNFIELWNLDEAKRFIKSFETQNQNNLS